MNQSTATWPREGMLAIARNRRGIITKVDPFPPEPGPEGRVHLVNIEYADQDGGPQDTLIWEREPGARVIEPASLPDVVGTDPMMARDFDAMIRASKWTSLTPTLPFGTQSEEPPIISPFFGAVRVEDYQLVPVLRALRMPRVALLLADAVGLGKTIECGLILRELILRRRIRRVLILCPAGLRRQWQQEMAEKFAIEFAIIDRKESAALQRRQGVDANPWRSCEKIITSYHYLRQPEVLEQFRAASQPIAGQPLLAWDLLIVDEAHNLSPAPFGDDSDLSKMLKGISPWFEHRIFLTATPHNGHTRSFSGLLEALDPVRFTRTTALTPDEKRRVEQVVVRRLKRDINCLTDPPLFVERQVIALPLRFGPEELALIRAFSDFRRTVRRCVASAGKGDRAAGMFAVEVLAKRLLSGPATFAQSWWRCMDGLEADRRVSSNLVQGARRAVDEELDDDTELECRASHAIKLVGTWLRGMAQRLHAPLYEIGCALADLGLRREDDAVPLRDRRYETLFAWCEQNLRQGQHWRDDERLIIFTEYKTSLDYLERRLKAHYGAETDAIRVLYGGMSDDERQVIKASFNDSADPVRILVATDAASEGLNLHETCRFLLHWDIPWNPSRMEQRNGRLDRHGQARDVQILHFSSDDDVSMRFMGKLLGKRSQILEDRVVADVLFSEAIEAHFHSEASADVLIEELDQALSQAEASDDLPVGDGEAGRAEREAVEQLATVLDLNPTTLRETLEVALGIDHGCPQLDGPDERGRFRLRPPLPLAWRSLIGGSPGRRDASGIKRALPGLAFDAETLVRAQNGRMVFRPERDTVLVHLGHPIFQRALAILARTRFGSDHKASASRWIVRRGPVPPGSHAVIHLSVEALALNELREPCHHWVRTLGFKVGSFGLEALEEELPAMAGPASDSELDEDLVEAAREIWVDVEQELKDLVRADEARLTDLLVRQLQTAGESAIAEEQRRYGDRLQALDRSLRQNTLARLERERDRYAQAMRQTTFLVELERQRERHLQDLNAELELRRRHYTQLREQLESERERLVDRVLPLRYRLRGRAQVLPLALEIRLPAE